MVTASGFGSSPYNWPIQRLRYEDVLKNTVIIENPVSESLYASYQEQFSHLIKKQCTCVFKKWANMFMIDSQWWKLSGEQLLNGEYVPDILQTLWNCWHCADPLQPESLQATPLCVDVQLSSSSCLTLPRVYDHVLVLFPTYRRRNTKLSSSWVANVDNNQLSLCAEVKPKQNL